MTDAYSKASLTATQKGRVSLPSPFRFFDARVPSVAVELVLMARLGLHRARELYWRSSRQQQNAHRSHYGTLRALHTAVSSGEWRAWKLAALHFWFDVRPTY